MYRISYLFFKLVGYTPIAILHIKSIFLSWLLRKIFKYRHSIVQSNLRNSFPNKTESERAFIEKSFYRNFTDTLLESFMLFSISKNNLKRRMKLVNPEVFQRLNKQNKGAIIIGAHYNNWEWMALSLSLYAEQDVYSVYKPLNNTLLNSLIKKARSRFGAKIIPMKSFAKTVLQNKYKATLNIMLADQSPHKSKLDFYCSFLNQDTPVYLGPEKLVKAANLELLFAEVQRVKRGFYELKIVSLTDQITEMKHGATHAHVKHLEKLIQSNPHSWLWSHKRWKHSRKK